MSEISAFLRERYNVPHVGATIERIERYWAAFRPYADPNFVREFCTNDPEPYQQRYWELFLGAMLLDQGLALRPNSGAGPDMSFNIAGRTVWVEAISPGPGIGNNRIPDMEFHDVGSLPIAGQEVPARETLLRFTAAIEEKVRKYREYRGAEIVAPGDPFVIALDASQLGIFGFHGISTHPTALEAVYPLGPMQVNFPIGGTDRQVTTEIQYRPSVANANRAEISTTRFLDVAYSGISGILCSSRNDGTRIPDIPMIFVHNKLASNPLLPLPIRVDEEYRLDGTPDSYRMVIIRAGLAG